MAMLWTLWGVAVLTVCMLWIQDRQIRELRAARNLQEDIFMSCEQQLWAAIDLAVRSDLEISADVQRLRDYQIVVGGHIAKALLANDNRIQEVADYAMHIQKAKGFLQ